MQFPIQLLNLFLALLLSSFGAETLKQNQDEEGTNKLQEAIDRIDRFQFYSEILSLTFHYLVAFNVAILLLCIKCIAYTQFNKFTFEQRNNFQYSFLHS